MVNYIVEFTDQLYDMLSAFFGHFVNQSITITNIADSLSVCVAVCIGFIIIAIPFGILYYIINLVTGGIYDTK